MLYNFSPQNNQTPNKTGTSEPKDRKILYNPFRSPNKSAAAVGENEEESSSEFQRGQRQWT
jgi:hypothetical protein